MSTEMSYFGIYDNGYDDIYYVTIYAFTKEEATKKFILYLENECKEDLAMNKDDKMFVLNSSFFSHGIF